MSQREAIKLYLKNGRPITPAKAMAEFGVWRLASIIHRLRNEGLPIITLRKQSVTGKPYAEYRLEA